MFYPGRNIKVGEQDADIVKALKKKLNEALGIEQDPSMRLNPNDPNFGPRMKQMIKLFQTRNLLKPDGVVGAITWAALFGNGTVPIITDQSDSFLTEVLKIAANEEAKQVREVPKNSNRGPEVDEYLRRAGVSPPNAWCCAFVYWCFDEAAQKMGCSNPMVKTAGCLNHWNCAIGQGTRCIRKQEAVDNPAVLKPGMVLVIDYGRGLGHTGFVVKVEGAWLTTIEGNTNASQTREGGGVYRLTRKIVDINKGFIDYSGI